MPLLEVQFQSAHYVLSRNWHQPNTVNTYVFQDCPSGLCIILRMKNNMVFISQCVGLCDCFRKPNGGLHQKQLLFFSTEYLILCLLWMLSIHSTYLVEYQGNTGVMHSLQSNNKWIWPNQMRLHIMLNNRPVSFIMSFNGSFSQIEWSKSTCGISQKYSH